MSETTATPLTMQQAVIVSAYTGFLIAPFGNLHEYAEQVLGRPVWTHEFASEDVTKALKAAAKEAFIALLPSEVTP